MTLRAFSVCIKIRVSIFNHLINLSNQTKANKYSTQNHVWIGGKTMNKKLNKNYGYGLEINSLYLASTCTSQVIISGDFCQIKLLPNSCHVEASPIKSLFFLLND